MKKIWLSLILSLVIFAGAYLTMCYLIPGMRIKLAAEPMEYFAESIKHMALFKSTVSLLLAVIAGSIPLLGKRQKRI